MILIFEGLDRCGKSTQIQKIMTHFAKIEETFHVLKYSNVKGLTNKESEAYSKKYYNQMFNAFYMLYSCDINVIADRAHLGEMVYSPIYRDYKGDYIYEIEKRWFIAMSINAWNSIFLITMVDDVLNVLEREDGKSMAGDNIELKNKEIGRFELAHKKSIIRHKLFINISGKDIEQVHKEIISFIIKGLKINVEFPRG